MELDPQTCFERLGKTRHGVLATVHPERGVDAVPVVFALWDDVLVIPIDTIKPKRTTVLRRITNLEADPRCVLLAEHYSDNWNELWWVRVHARGSVIRTEIPDEALSTLAEAHPQYATSGSVAAVIVLAPYQVTGWQASAD